MILWHAQQVELLAAVGRDNLEANVIASRAALNACERCAVAAECAVALLLLGVCVCESVSE